MSFINRKPFIYYSLIVFSVLSGGCRNADPSASGVPPEKALATFEIAPGFQIEMIASEPLISDPVAMEIDEYGRLYVIEMHGYPLDKSGSGKVKLLTDTDGEGRMDKSVTFADHLVLPTGVLRWKKGILVTDPPNVLYFEDTNGDGKADIRDTLLTGFALSNPQHNVNNPVLGMDNWIYLGHEPAVTTQLYKDEFGDLGGEVYYPKQTQSPHLPQNARGRSVRFRPDQSRLEILSSNTQFGQTFDIFGRHLLVSNANHIFHEVIAASYLNRNPDLLVSNATQSVSDHGAAAEVFSITKNPQHQLLTDVGVFTSACGLTAYSGGLFPSPFDSVTFVAEPVSNIVHADLLKNKGTSFTASRLYPNKEFLASTDAWFRPVNMYVGPDGALYVIDYYRQIIEHPEWMAEEVVKSGALYNGMDKGRLYRITPKGAKAAAWSENMKIGDDSNDLLIEKLNDPNSWQRRTAQRLLIDRNNKKSVPGLESMVQNPDAPLGRLHALWTLEGLNQLRPDLIRLALKDPVAGIRENAIRLAEQQLNAYPGLADALAALQDDPDPKVRFQLLCTMGSINTAQAAEVREALLFRDLDDPWMQIAALSTPSDKMNMLESVLTRYKPEIPAYGSLIERLSEMIGASGQTVRIQSLIRKAVQPAEKNKEGWQASILKGLAQSMKNKKLSSSLQSEQKLLLKAAFDHPLTPVREASIALLTVTGLPEGPETALALERAIKISSDHTAPTAKRTEAIEFIAMKDPAVQTDLLKKLIAPNEPLTVQLAALGTLSAAPGTASSIYILEKWPALTPDLRDAAINTFLRNDERIALLLDAIENAKIDQASIGWPRSVRLMAQKNEKLRTRARALLTKEDDERSGVLSRYQSALSLTGDGENGKIIYQKNCATCHQIGGATGIAFGPDLGTIRNRNPKSILADIIDPNKSIADGYDIWLVELNSGESMQGLIATETPTALTLKNYGGQEKTISRQDIKSLKALGMSSMPVGLEKQINPREMADLLNYVRNPK